MTEQKKRGLMRVWACGGMGVNIGKALEVHRNQLNPGTAEVEITYADTSDGQTRGIDADYCYHVKNDDGTEIDGSGQIQAENASHILNSIKDMLLMHKPGDLNVVVHSASGGSGSVIGMALVEELLRRGHNVVVIMVGAKDTRKFMTNTRSTIKSYEHIAANVVQQPVIAFYFENNAESPRAVVDEAVLHIVGTLSILASRQNDELDTRDLHNFLHFNKKGVSSFAPQLASMSLIASGSDLTALVGNVITLATLAVRGPDADINIRREYQITGYLPTDIDAKVSSSAPLHFVTTDGYFNSVLTGLNKEIKEFDDNVAARRPQTSILTSADKPSVGNLLLE